MPVLQADRIGSICMRMLSCCIAVKYSVTGADGRREMPDYAFYIPLCTFTVTVSCEVSGAVQPSRGAEALELTSRCKTPTLGQNMHVRDELTVALIEPIQPNR